MRAVGSLNERTYGLRTRILDAALEVFLEEGIFAGSLDQVCRAADISKGSLFHHFRSKEALAAEITANALEALFQARHVGVETGARDGVTKLVGGTLDWFERNRALGIWLMVAPRWEPGDPDAAPIEEVRRRHLEYVGYWLHAQHRARVFRRLPITAYEPLVVGPTWQFLQGWVHRRKQAELKKIRPVLIQAAWLALARSEPAR